MRLDRSRMKITVPEKILKEYQSEIQRTGRDNKRDSGGQKLTITTFSDHEGGVISLEPYEEIVGRLITLEKDGERLLVRLSTGTLSFPIDSQEAAAVTEILKGCEGTIISILRTDTDGSPIVIRCNGPDSDESGGEFQ